MAPAHSRPGALKRVPDGHILRLGIDLGTGKIQIDYQHIHGAVTQQEAEIKPISLKDDQTACTAQIAILPAIGAVIYGTAAVEKAIREDPALQDRVLELWKLALHPEFHHLEEVAHVQETLFAHTNEQVDRAAAQDFMEEQLRGIIQDIREYFKASSRNAGEDASYWDGIPLELQISVPAMWGDHQKGLVWNAAYDALGNSDPRNKIELREEPLCVATVYMLDLVKSRAIREGQCLLLVDCGKGTLDIATVKLVRAPTKDVLMQLQRVGPCSGNGAGSHIINTQAWEWLLSGGCPDVQNFDQRCEQLGITRRDFLRQFIKGIDRVKSETHDMPNGTFVTILSRHGTRLPGQLPRLTIELPPQAILTWYKTWTDSAVQLVKEHLNMHNTEQYKYASLTGGGCLATAFRAAIRLVLGQAPYNIEIATATACISPCSQGALLQHYFQENKLPPVANFYIAQNEEYEQNIHKNATAQGSQYKPRVLIVEERLQKIMRYENGTFTGAGRIPLKFLVEDNDIADRIHVDAYYSGEDLEDHSALRIEGGALRPGIHSYPLISMDLETLSEHGFKSKNGGISGGKKYFEVRTYVQMKGNADSLKIRIEVMQHFHRFSGENYAQPYHKDDVLWTFNREVWNKSMSHFVSNITGTASPTGLVNNAVPTAASSDATASSGATVSSGATASSGAIASSGATGAASATTAAVPLATNAPTPQGHRNTSHRLVRNRVTTYAEDEDMEED
jgi:hypothetical protein